MNGNGRQRTPAYTLRDDFEDLTERVDTLEARHEATRSIADTAARKSDRLDHVLDGIEDRMAERHQAQIDGVHDRITDLQSAMMRELGRISERLGVVHEKAERASDTQEDAMALARRQADALAALAPNASPAKRPTSDPPKSAAKDKWVWPAVGVLITAIATLITAAAQSCH